MNGARKLYFDFYTSTSHTSISVVNKFSTLVQGYRYVFLYYDISLHYVLYAPAFNINLLPLALLQNV